MSISEHDAVSPLVDEYLRLRAHGPLSASDRGAAHFDTMLAHVANCLDCAERYSAALAPQADALADDLLGAAKEELIDAALNKLAPAGGTRLSHADGESEGLGLIDWLRRNLEGWTAVSAHVVTMRGNHDEGVNLSLDVDDSASIDPLAHLSAVRDGTEFVGRVAEDLLPSGVGLAVAAEGGVELYDMVASEAEGGWATVKTMVPHSISELADTARYVIAVVLGRDAPPKED